MTDRRYTVDLEFCGYSKARYVARFCGQWISQHRTKKAAQRACLRFEKARWS